MVPDMRHPDFYFIISNILNFYFLSNQSLHLSNSDKKIYKIGFQGQFNNILIYLKSALIQKKVFFG